MAAIRASRANMNPRWLGSRGSFPSKGLGRLCLTGGLAVSLAALPSHPLQASELSDRFAKCRLAADGSHGVALGTETAGGVEQVRDKARCCFHSKSALEPFCSSPPSPPPSRKVAAHRPCMSGHGRVNLVRCFQATGVVRDEIGK